jgi:Na+-driven multidrug efflux pump
MALFDANRCFLNALNYTFVPTVVQLAGVPLHLCWAYYFVRVKDFGMLGVCYAQNITYFTLFLLITAYS